MPKKAKLTLDELLEKHKDKDFYEKLVPLVREIHELEKAIKVREQEPINLNFSDITEGKKIELFRQEAWAQRNFHRECVSMAEYLLENVTPPKKRSILTHAFHPPLPPSKEKILEDVSLMTKTIQFAKGVVSNPQNINEERVEQFRKHGSAIDNHLKQEKTATKKSRLWGGVLIAFSILLIPATMVAACVAVAAGLSTFGVASIPLAIGVGVIGSVLSVDLMILGFQLREGARHLERQADLHSQAASLRKKL